MPEFTLDKVQLLYTMDQKIMASYSYLPGVPASSSTPDFIEIPLPGLNNDAISYRHIPNLDFSGKSYGAIFFQFGVASDSKLYTLGIFNKAGTITDLQNTINDVFWYEDVVYSYLDDNFSDFAVRNADVPVTNKLYAHVINKDTFDTGPIYLEVTYITLQVL